MKRALGLVLLACLLAYASGCRIVVTREPVRVFRAEKLEPEGWYRTLFDALQKCTGTTKPYDDIEWFVVEPGRMGTVEEDGMEVPIVGLFSPTNRIYLAETRVMDGRIVGHEIVHYLTDESDTPLFYEMLEACGI